MQPPDGERRRATAGSRCGIVSDAEVLDECRFGSTHLNALLPSFLKRIAHSICAPTASANACLTLALMSFVAALVGEGALWATRSSTRSW